MTPENIDELFSRFQSANPHPQTELNYTNPYTLLVAVALSAQATDIGVNKATKNLFAIVDTPQKMLDLGEAALKTYIKTIGLFNTKAKNVMAAAEILVRDYQGEIPRTRQALETLPGVGRKTANVVLNIAFGEPTIAVDTHIFRVSNRLGLAQGKTPLAVELQLEKVIPANFRQHAHHWLILHGRYICKAQRPQCQNCPVRDLCDFVNKGL
ncbi:MAG: endonuclease III [Candidatus Paracaedibacteraceae bacterium]|nr:endonuclease III [Candidatus Paracaedibacteraceae bacterium]